jgi:hypothetical protein
MLLVRLLWDPLPDALPGSGLRRLPRLRDLAVAMTAGATRVSEQERVQHQQVLELTSTGARAISSALLKIAETTQRTNTARASLMRQ